MNTPTPYEALREEARAVPPSGIIDVVTHGWGREGLIPLWAGEGDLPTPSFICDAATRSLAAGETFYQDNRGIPEIRAALASYHEALYGRPFPQDRFLVTGSGMQSIQLAAQALVGAGDELLVPTPAWPNMAAATMVLGARPVEVPMSFDGSRWRLPLERLEGALTPRTRAIFVNTPSNPAGWVADEETLAALVDLSRRHGVWIIADEIYARFSWGEGRTRAPSFHDVAADDDLVIHVNTFSKNWAMTGWRIGWVLVPEDVAPVMKKLIQYATSGVATFMQRAGVVALEHGAGFVDHQVARARKGREIVLEALGDHPKVRLSMPDGAFYALFEIAGTTDAAAQAKRIVDEANVGLAPGTAFGAGAETFQRLCFARGEESLREAMGRLVDWLDRV